MCLFTNAPLKLFTYPKHLYFRFIFVGDCCYTYSCIKYVCVQRMGKKERNEKRDSGNNIDNLKRETIIFKTQNAKSTQCEGKTQNAPRMPHTLRARVCVCCHLVFFGRQFSSFGICIYIYSRTSRGTQAVGRSTQQIYIFFLHETITPIAVIVVDPIR